MLEQIEFPESTFYIPQTAGDGVDSDLSIDAMFAQAMAEPIDYPQLEHFILDGDRLAIVLLGNLPQPEQVLIAVLNQLSVALSDPQIVVVISPTHAAAFDKETVKRITANCATEVEFSMHDPNDSNSVACIANNFEGKPIYINRQMFDADVVIPVGTLLESVSLPANSYYPEFSSDEVRQRFKNGNTDVSQNQLDGEVRMAERHLGTEFTILVLRGAGGSVVGVRAGSSDSIRNHTSSEMKSLWSIECQDEGDVVVATIEGEPAQQSWDDVFHAIAAAAAASQTVQQIVICTQLEIEPNNQQMDVLQLQFEVDLDARCRKLAQLTGAAQAIPGILESTSVSLFSRLAQDRVEEAGLGFIESEQQVQGIVDRASSGILLRDAHLCRVKIGAIDG